MNLNVQISIIWHWLTKWFSNTPFLFLVWIVLVTKLWIILFLCRWQQQMVIRTGLRTSSISLQVRELTLTIQAIASLISIEPLEKYLSWRWAQQFFLLFSSWRKLYYSSMFCRAFSLGVKCANVCGTLEDKWCQERY